jgi:hypothetical protein
MILQQRFSFRLFACNDTVILDSDIRMDFQTDKSRDISRRMRHLIFFVISIFQSYVNSFIVVSWKYFDSYTSDLKVEGIQVPVNRAAI